MPAAYAAGGTTPLLVRRGRQRGPGGNSPNGAPALAQPIAVASGGISGVEFCDDHHTLLSVLILALPPVLGPLLRLLLPGHPDQSSEDWGRKRRS
jgi:hypothetical protein